MATFWIIHRNGSERAALARLAGVGDRVFQAAPTDARLATQPQPDVVVLGLADDFELELDFVHRSGARLARCAWILIPEARYAGEARRLFDTLPCRVIAFPPTAEELRGAIQAATVRLSADSLFRRTTRSRLSARFARWFADLELPTLMRAVDPQLGPVPLLIRGEPGTGRGLVARYLHAFGEDHNSPLLHLACNDVHRPRDLLDQIEDAVPGPPEARCTIWLEDCDRLPLPLQRLVASWIELGLPEGEGQVSGVRWIVGAGDPHGVGADSLEPGLAQLVSTLVIRIPPLRERDTAVESFAASCALEWCHARGENPRSFSRDALLQLRAYPWPGNMRELEAVVTRTLAASSADPVSASDLRFESGDSVDRGVDHAPAEHEPEEHGGGSRFEGAESRLEKEEDSAPVARPETPATERRADLAPEAWQRLVGAIAHEIRNPLVSIRTLAELLPEHFDDEEFRTRFTDLVGSDVRRIEKVVGQLQEMTGSSTTGKQSVDIAGLLESLLDEHRGEIQARHLLVLKELDRSQPFALGNPQQLHGAFSRLIAKALSLAPDRGDLYVASKHNPTGLRGKPSLRVLLRYQTAASQAEDRRLEDAAMDGLSESDVALEFITADAAVRNQGGTFTMDTTDAQERVIVIDLPAPT